MATADQVQQMLDLLKEQMATVTTLQEENANLRETAAQAAVPNNDTDARSATVNTNDPRYNTKKPDRPVIDTELDDCDWELFLDTWNRYKEMIFLPATDVHTIRNEVRAACSNEVNKLLFEYVGKTKLSTCTEEDLLNYVKSVAVKVKHKEVHRLEFGQMVQKDNQKVSHFIAALKAKATLCKFEVKCGHEDDSVVSYAEERVSERLIAGLRNPEHTNKLLSEATTLLTLADKERRLEALESTEESTSLLHKSAPPVTAAATRSLSTYKLKKKTPKPEEGVDTGSLKCLWCGKTSHGADKTLERIHCPAQDKKCNYCHIKGHLATVCKKKAAASIAAPAETVDHNDEIADIPADASVSFAFAATPVPLSDTDTVSDFRLARRPTKKR